MFRRFPEGADERPPYLAEARGLFHPEDGGDTFLQNVG
jgi:hypothetical protein